MTRVAIMITTKNRVEELERTLAKVAAFSPPPHEILLTADGCSDTTVEFVQSHYSNIHLTVNEFSLGSVASRAAMMKRTTCEFVLALDDDSYPEQQDCLKTLSEIFANDSHLAVATFPQRTDEYPETLRQGDFGAVRSVRSFPNSGACIRVSTYRQLPGFEPLFFHMYEEPDYALQCVAHGFTVVYFPSITVRHHWTPNQRSEIRNHHRHARNEFCSTVMRCPLPQLLPLIAYRVFAQARYASSRGVKWLLQEPVWWWQAISKLPRAFASRQPVTWQGYKNWLSLPD